MGGKLSLLQDFHRRELCFLLESVGSAQYLSPLLEEMLLKIAELCPFFPEEGTLDLKLWEKVGEVFKNNAEKTLSVWPIWKLSRDAIAKFSSSNNLLLQEVPNMSNFPILLPPKQSLDLQNVCLTNEAEIALENFSVSPLPQSDINLAPTSSQFVAASSSAKGLPETEEQKMVFKLEAQDSREEISELSVFPVISSDQSQKMVSVELQGKEGIALNSSLSLSNESLAETGKSVCLPSLIDQEQQIPDSLCLKSCKKSDEDKRLNFSSISSLDDFKSCENLIDKDLEGFQSTATVLDSSEKIGNLSLNGCRISIKSFPEAAKSELFFQKRKDVSGSSGKNAVSLQMLMARDSLPVLSKDSWPSISALQKLFSAKDLLRNSLKKKFCATAKQQPSLCLFPEKSEKKFSFDPGKSF